MSYKKIFGRVFMMLFIVSIVVLAVGCDNETAAGDKVIEKKLSAADLSRRGVRPLVWGYKPQKKLAKIYFKFYNVKKLK